MSKKTRNITLSALYSALAVISLYIASIWPTGQLGLTAVASLFVAAAVIESGISFGIYVYVISSLIGVLIVPNIAPMLFILFFGYYPILKSLIERLKQKALQIILKLFVLNIAFTVIWFLFNELFLTAIDFDLHVIIIFLIGNIVFLFFDYGLTKLIWFYITRISEMIKK